MSIFSKLSTVIKSNINDLISRAENPEKMLNQIILDMRDQLAKAKREVAAAIADERKLRPPVVRTSASVVTVPIRNAFCTDELIFVRS